MVRFLRVSAAFDLGLERTGGFKVVWQCEIDEYCRRVLAKHWPDVKRYGDVRNLPAELERVDVVCGGFPCQPVSVAGKQLRQDDERWLWPDFAAVLRVVRPRYAIIENVPGLFNGGMGDVLGDLAEMRFDAEWHVIPAEAVGSPQLRERVWIVATTDTEAQRRGEAREYQPRRQAERLSRSVAAGVLQAPDDRGERIQGVCAGPIPRFSEFSWCKDVRRAEDLFGRSDIPEPLFRGSRDGVSDWVDRTHALGNAVVPQIVTWIGHRILEYENARESTNREA